MIVLDCMQDLTLEDGGTFTYWSLGAVAVISKETFLNWLYSSGLGTHCEFAIGCMPQNLTNDELKLVQVMA